jgi:hypothetical protein
LPDPFLSAGFKTGSMINEHELYKNKFISAKLKRMKGFRGPVMRLGSFIKTGTSQPFKRGSAKANAITNESPVNQNQSAKS